MRVDWSALGLVALVSLLGAVLLVALFSLGIRALAGKARALERGGSGTAPLAGAVACFGISGLLAVAGVIMIATS